MLLILLFNRRVTSTLAVNKAVLKSLASRAVSGFLICLTDCSFHYENLLFPFTPPVTLMTTSQITKSTASKH